MLLHNVCSKCVLPSSDFPFVLRLVTVFLPKLLYPKWTVFQLIERFPGILEFRVSYPSHPVLYYPSIFSGVYNGLNVVDIFFILFHVLWLVPSAEWLKEGSVDNVVPSCALRNLQLIGVYTNSFRDLIWSYPLVT